jgi:hypothetical protein
MQVVSVRPFPRDISIFPCAVTIQLFELCFFFSKRARVFGPYKPFFLILFYIPYEMCKIWLRNK